MCDEASLSPSGHRVLAAAEQLFYARGITAVGVDLVAERSGVTKRTLYNQFGSKDALVTAYLRRRDRRWRQRVEDALAARPASPREALLAPFHVLADWVRDNPRGCAFINALAELPDPHHPGHQVAAAEKRWLLALFTRLGEEAGLAEPAELAAQLLCLHEGALALRPLGLEAVDTATGLATRLVLDRDHQPAPCPTA